MEKQPSHLPLAIISVILSGLIFGLLGYWYGADVNSSTPASTVNPSTSVSASPVAISSSTPIATAAPSESQINSAVDTYLSTIKPSATNHLGYTSADGKVFYGKKLLFSSTKANVTTVTYYLVSMEYVKTANSTTGNAATLCTATSNQTVKECSGSSGIYVFALTSAGPGYAVSIAGAPQNDQPFSKWVPVDAQASVSAFYVPSADVQTEADRTAYNARVQAVEDLALNQAVAYYATH